jgi:hypothetical protein
MLDTLAQYFSKEHNGIALFYFFNLDVADVAALQHNFLNELHVCGLIDQDTI